MLRLDEQYHGKSLGAPGICAIFMAMIFVVFDACTFMANNFGRQMIESAPAQRLLRYGICRCGRRAGGFMRFALAQIGINPS